MSSSPAACPPSRCPRGDQEDALVNQALKSVSNRAKRRELVEILASGDRVELDVIDEAWR